MTPLQELQEGWCDEFQVLPVPYVAGVPRSEGRGWGTPLKTVRSYHWSEPGAECAMASSRGKKGMTKYSEITLEHEYGI